MNCEGAEKQFSAAYPAAALINHCHTERGLCCCCVSEIDEQAHVQHNMAAGEV